MADVSPSIAHKKARADHRQPTGIINYAQGPNNQIPTNTAIERDTAERKSRSSTDDAPPFGLPNVPLLVTSGNSYQKTNCSEGRADQISFPPYGHHRQTSIVNGIQHSRNSSLVTSKSSSPLSPQVVGAGQFAGNTSSRDNMRPPLEEKTNSPATSRRPSISDTTVRPSASNSSAENYSLSNSIHGEASKAGRKHSVPHQTSKVSRKDKMHSQSQSRSELKTVGEYALHHLFNSV